MTAIARVRLAPFIPFLFVAALVAYKSNGAHTTIQKVKAAGAMSTRPDVIAFGGHTIGAALERTLNYFAVIWPALVFGILISAAVRAFIPEDWFARHLTGSRMRAQIVSGLAGVPLMLCSCCVVSVFNTVYERSYRLGPSIAVMLASPALNPAALTLTFLLFNPEIAVARLAIAATAVVASGFLVDGVSVKPETMQLPTETRSVGTGFLQSLMHVVVRTIPTLVIGVICSMLLVEYVPSEWLISSGFRSLAVIVTASIALPIALPTFFEIPLALGLVAAGAPAGAAVALLFAGPVINLPSLLSLARRTNWKTAASLAGLIWTLAVFGGLILNLLTL